MTGSITDILPSAAALLGVPGAPDPLGLCDRHDDVRRVVVILVDGLGLHLLPRLAPHAPFLASVLAGSTGTLDELTCTFPSTTPTSLVSLGTGVRPGEHGILGFTVNVPGTSRLLTHVAWRDDPPPRQWQPVPTWFERCAAAGVPTVTVLPSLFGGSGLTDAAYRGARFAGVAEHADPAERIVAELAAGPGLVYGYTPVLDTAAHVFGIASPEWAHAAAQVDAFLTRVAEALPADALLLVTADHGGLDVPAGPGPARLDLADEPALRAGVSVLAGEPRVRYLHTVDGAAEDVRATWSAILGDRGTVHRRDEAIDAGWFGPVADAHRDRIGDLVVVCRGATAVLDSEREPPELSRLVGFHGADDPVETAIPLITVRGGG